MAGVGVPGRDLTTFAAPALLPLVYGWRLAPQGAFEWRQWQDEAVVFVHASGDTHALGTEASAVLAVMRRHPQEAHSGDDWLQAAGYDAVTPDDVAAEQLMAHLEKLGLVHRLAP